MTTPNERLARARALADAKELTKGPIWTWAKEHARELDDDSRVALLSKLASIVHGHRDLEQAAGLVGRGIEPVLDDAEWEVRWDVVLDRARRGLPPKELPSDSSIPARLRGYRNFPAHVRAALFAAGV